MNIDKIVKECPDVIEELKSYMGFSFVGRSTIDFEEDNIVFRGTNSACLIHYRDLFDYFDSVGINVGVMPLTDKWHWSISKKRFWRVTYLIGRPKGGFVWSRNPYEDKHGYKPDFKSRIEAEYKAFELAFEIRQQQIEGNSKDN